MRFGSRELIFLMVLLAVPTAAYFSPWDTPVPGLRRLNARIADVQHENERKRNKLRELQASAQHLESLPAEIEKLTEAVEYFERKLPAQEEVQVILRDVTELAAKHDLTVNRVRPEKIASTARYGKRPIKMQIDGDFYGFYEFILDMENLPRITRVQSMSLERSNDRDGNMHAELVLNIYFEGSNTDDEGDSSEEQRS